MNIENDEEKSEQDLGSTLASLYKLICARRANRPENSYTTYLFNSGIDKILKKIGEESAETIIAAKNSEPEPFVSEVADLLYHLTVLLVERGVTLDEVNAELTTREKK